MDIKLINLNIRIRMKTKIFTLLLTFFSMLGVGNSVFGQAVGDYGSTAASGTPGTMDWLTGTWYICASAGTWTGSTTTTTPPDQTKNVWILAGDVVNLTSATFVQGKCKNLEVAGTLTLVDAKVENSQVYGNIHVASTGTITANPKFIWGNWNTSMMTLTVDAGGVFLLKDQFKLYGANGATTTITNNGILGASTVVTGAGATIYIINQSSAVGNSNVIFTGTGTTIFRRLYADTSAGSFNITFDQNVTFSPASADPGIKLQNASGVTATSARSITINEGKTVTISSGWFANNATAFTGIDANNTFNINGTLDASAASTYFGCTTNTTADQRGTTNSQIINIGSTGTLKCGSVVRVNKPQSGQTLAVNVAEGGTITYAGTAYQTLPTVGTFAVTASPYALLTNSNSNLSFTNASSAVTMNSDVTVSGNLVLPASGTWSGTGKTIMTGAGKTISAGTMGALEISTGAAENIITTSGTLTANGDITVTTGALTMGADITAYNVSVGSGAILTANIGANSFSRRTLKVGNGVANNDATVTVNGTLGGTKWSGDGIDIQVSANAKTLNINGTGGTIAISGLRPAINADSRALDITINQSMYLDRDNGGAANLEPALTLQNGTCSFTRTLTIPENVTVTLRGNCGLHGLRNAVSSVDELVNNYASSSSNQGNCIYNVNGTLDLAVFNAICNLNTCSYSGSTQSVIVNVGSAGTLKLANIVKMYTALSGQSVSIVPTVGSTIEYGYNGTATFLLTTGTGVAPTLPAVYGNLTFSNSSGISIPTDFSVAGTLIMSQNLTAGTITMLPGAKATLASGKTFTASVLNLQSSASGTATFVNDGIATITSATVQQYLPDTRNWYVSSPVTGAVAPAGYTYYQRDEVASSWVSQVFVAGNTFIAGKGYIALPGASASTLQFSGTLNSASVNTTLTKSGTGFNLIGNPYPAHLSWTTAFVDDVTNAALIEPTIWVRTNAGTLNNSNQWSFLTYNGHSGEAVPSTTILSGGIIPPMQAFWVKAKAAGTLTLDGDLTKSHQALNPLKAPALKKSDRQRLRLEMSNGSTTDETLLYFDVNASNSFDTYDSPKFTETKDVQIYTTAGTEKLVINGLNTITDNMHIPLGIKTTQSGTFTLKPIQLENIASDTKVYLLDGQSQTELELNKEYTFTSDATDSSSRFSLLFKAPSLTTQIESIANKKHAFNVYRNANGQLTVTVYETVNSTSKVTISNQLGQKLSEGILTGAISIVNEPLATGVYFVTVSSNGKSTTQKVVFN